MSGMPPVGAHHRATRRMALQAAPAQGFRAGGEQESIGTGIGAGQLFYRPNLAENVVRAAEAKHLFRACWRWGAVTD